MAARRRTTLGGVSASTLNSRNSMSAGFGSSAAAGGGGGGGVSRQGIAGGGRMSMAASKRQSMVMSSMSKPSSRQSFAAAAGGGGGGAGGGGGRSSMAATASSRSSLAPRHSGAGGTGGRKSSGVRRSSAYGAGSGRNDPRPIGDRAYTNASIRALVEYLADHNYDQPISAKILTRPSGRDFNNIMTFLFSQYDPAWQPSAPSGRFEEEVITMLKSMGYPFSLSKASLAAVGAPQTWPKMLAAISWILELLLYDEEVQAYEADQQLRRALGETDAEGLAEADLNAHGRLDDKAFFDYLGRAYKAFLDGEDEQYAALEEELKGGYEAQTVLIEGEVTALEEQKRSLVAAIEECRGRANLLPELQQKKADLEGDVGKFDRLIEQLTTHRQGLESKVSIRTGEETALKEELAAIKEQISALRERIQGQELSAEDVQRMAREQQRLKDGMSSATEHKSLSLKRLWEAEMMLAQRLDGLDSAVHTYNSKAAVLQLIPLGARNAAGVDFELSVCREAVSDEDRILTNDVKGTIVPALQVLKEAAVKRMHDARQELLELLDEEEESEEAVAELADRVGVLSHKVRRAEEAYRKEKEQLEAAALARAREVEALETRLSDLRDPAELERSLLSLSQQTEGLRAELEGVRASHEEEKRALHEAVLEALNACTEQKEMEQRILSETRELVVQGREEVCAAGSVVKAVTQRIELEQSHGQGGACKV